MKRAMKITFAEKNFFIAAKSEHFKMKLLLFLRSNIDLEIFEVVGARKNLCTKING